MPSYSWYVILVYVVIMIKRGVSTERFETFVITSVLKILKYFYMLIEFNTFQKHSADSKLSTNTYLMSVAAVFQKL